jgi:hypothetical protein
MVIVYIHSIQPENIIQKHAYYLGTCNMSWGYHYRKLKPRGEVMFATNQKNKQTKDDILKGYCY